MSGQIIAYIFTGLLFLTAVVMGLRKSHGFAVVCVILAFIAFLIGEISGSGSTPGRKLLITPEIFVCWVFASGCFGFAILLLKEKEIGYSLLTLLISTFAVFCSLSGVQSLLKTHLLWQVTTSLKDYGDKLDQFQASVATMEENLRHQEDTNNTTQHELAKLGQQISTAQSNLNNQQKTNYATQSELQRLTDSIQRAQANLEHQEETNRRTQGKLAELEPQLSEAMIKINTDQNNIETQFGQIKGLASEVKTAQSNLVAQQAKIQNVESLAGVLYSNTVVEYIRGIDTNRFWPIPWRGTVLLKLDNAPILGSLQIIKAQENIGNSPLFPADIHCANVISFNYAEDWSLWTTNTTYYVRYIRDPLQTNLINRLSIDGRIFRIDDPTNAPSSLYREFQESMSHAN